MTWALLIAAAYLVGSIPFGLLIGMSRGIDIREHGSRNIGATNAGRVLGRPWGLLCFALDLLKGALPVIAAGWRAGLLGRAILAPTEAALWIAVAVAAVLGHMFPIYLRFKGGKGVATGFGVLLGLWGVLTVPALVALAVWVVAARLTRYVSLSSCLAAGSLPIAAAAWVALSAGFQGRATIEGLRHAWPFFLMTVGLAGLVVWKHRANLARIRAGTEPKIGPSRGESGASRA